jgi:5-methylcytosine-specific restriction endonuclease McrBC regulatory subunit McrC
MYLHFSPMQNKSGLLVYHHEGLTLNLIVLPKMWRPKGERLNPWDFSKTTLNVIAYEGERHHIAPPKEATNDIIEQWEDWKDLLQHCCDTLSSKTKLEDSDDDLLDTDTLKSLSGLMSTISKPKEDLITKFSDKALEYNFSKQVENLFKLALFSSTSNNFDINIFQSNDDQVVALTDDSTIEQNSPIFRMLAVENFLSEIETHLHKIHQGYVKTTEQLDTIRGSVTGTSLMMLDAGVSLKPRCRYNKFVPNIPLYQLLVTTLDAIHRGWCIPNDPILKHIGIVKDTQKRALRLRTKLRHITSFPLEVARNTCQRLHLNRLQQFWKPSINLSKILLRNKPVFIDNSASGSGGYMWIVNTAAVWESVLAQSLAHVEHIDKNAIFTAGEPITGSKPWGNLGDSPEADIVAITGKQLYIFDAKYKINADRSNKSRSKGEEYQLFAYSYLINPKACMANHKHLGLVYPTFETPTTSEKNHKRYKDTNATLELYYLPFPQSKDVYDKVTWSQSMETIGTIWQRLIPTVDQPPANSQEAS